MAFGARAWHMLIELPLLTAVLELPIFHIGDDNTQLRFPAADTFAVETGGSEALRVDSNQRLLVKALSAQHRTDIQFFKLPAHQTIGRLPYIILKTMPMVHLYL